MEERNTIATLYKLAQESEKSREKVNGLVYDKIQRLKSDIYNLEEILKAYINLEKELRKQVKQMSNKVSKKMLKDIAQKFSAYHHGGNVYSYENAIYYIQNYTYTSEDIENKDEFKSNKYYNRDELRELVCKYKKLGYKMSAEQLYYSAGVYGNNGQLHKIRVYDKDYKEHLETFFIYYG